MKKLFAISLIALLSACGGKESESTEQKNILENLTYSVDTVVVDAGEDFFNLSYGIAPRLSHDKKTLLFFEGDPLKLVQVDLNNLKLNSKTEFQHEGPDGVGPYIVDYQVGHEGNLAIKSYVGIGNFSTEGKLVETLKIFPASLPPGLEDDYLKLYGPTIYSSKANRIYTQPSTEVLGEPALFSIDPDSKTYQSFPIPKVKLVTDFSGTYRTKSSQGTMIRFLGPETFMGIENGHLFISGGAMSGFYSLDTNTDSLRFIDIEHQIAPNQWDFEVMKESSDESKFEEDERKVNEALNYLDIKWDETREMYLRFGKKTFLGKTRADPRKYELYLFAYDKDFNVLGETKIEGLEKVPSSYFWKDGKLYSYVNVEDELGFAVFTFDF
ncbi:DUF4221 family protein [uncultured Algoriphagus sp.]|uniref:DUF4221 family protein n=1 Tax=uncultured Algoriphagus sp. TaxID=417365 RepID=UPI0030EC5180|tara:strand:+ start:168 stop:1316 length:1149 start_codon:yes stop_codon:yes gene_type:complete